MKIVFTKQEVANALSLTVIEFEQTRPKLEANCFPKPIAGLQERWSIIDVINWVNRRGQSTTSNFSIDRHEQQLRLN